MVRILSLLKFIFLARHLLNWKIADLAIGIWMQFLLILLNLVLAFLFPYETKTLLIVKAWLQ